MKIKKYLNYLLFMFTGFAIIGAHVWMLTIPKMDAPGKEVGMIGILASMVLFTGIVLCAIVYNPFKKINLDGMSMGQVIVLVYTFLTLLAVGFYMFWIEQ